MTDVQPDATDIRLLAQERLLDAVLRVLAIRDPRFVEAVRGVLIDTVQTQVAPTPGASIAHHISQRLRDAEQFAKEYSGETTA